MRIHSYDIELDVDFKKSLIKGRISAKVEGATSPFTMDASGLDIGEVRVDGEVSSFRVGKEKLSIPGVPKRLSRVDVTYRKQVADNSIFGLYKSKFGKEHFLVTDLEPAHARTVFPCIDEPAYKAVIRLKVKVDKGLSAIANTPIASVRNLPGGRREFTFEPSPKMSTYLFFVGIGKFEESSKKAGKVDVIAASRAGGGKTTAFSLAVAADVLQALQKYFDVPYPMKKLHLVALPEYHTGAMENWGAITFREPFIVTGDSPSTSDLRRSGHIIAHEEAHMWFGDLVTMKWWDDLWLNESFASFMDHKILDKVHPEWDNWREFLRRHTFGSLETDALSTTHPVQVKVKTVDEIEGIFDAISYGKGASVLRMIESFIGEDAFRRGVSSYLKKFAFSNARGEDLWASLQKASGRPVSKIMPEWVKRPGYPVVRVNRSGDGFELSQERFSLTKRKGNEVWPIPVTYTADGKSGELLLKGKSARLRCKDPDTLIVNPGRTGFYTVLYDEGYYKTLAKRFPSLHPHDRAGMMNDLSLFLLAGTIPPSTYFRFVDICGKISDPMTSRTVSDQLSFLRAIAWDSNAVRNSYRLFMKGQFDRIGLEPKKGEEEWFGEAREWVTTGLARTDDGFDGKLSPLFENFNSLDPNIKTAVAIAYARAGGRPAFDRLLALVKKEPNEFIRTKFYAALMSIDDPSLIEDLLELPMTQAVSRSDSAYTLGYAAVNPKAMDVLWRWIVKRYDALLEMYGGSQQFYLYMNAYIPNCGLGHEREARKFISGKRYKEGEITYRRTFEMLSLTSRLRARLIQDN